MSSVMILNSFTKSIIRSHSAYVVPNAFIKLSWEFRLGFIPLCMVMFELFPHFL